MGGNAPRRRSDVEAFSDYDDAPSQERMRGGVRTPRNPTTDQKAIRRRQRTATEEHAVTEGNRMSQENGHSTESVVARLLRQAAVAPTLAESQRLVGEAERLRSEALIAHQAGRQLDLAGAEVRDTLTPAPVHELHTASTDWIGTMDTGAPENARQQMIAVATSWYGELHPAVRADAGEFRIQAEGVADRECGAYGEDATAARQSFLTMCATLRSRDLQAGHIHEATVTGDQVQPMGAADVLGQNPPTGEGYQGLPGSTTDSNRAPAFQDMGGQPEAAAGPDGSQNAGVGGGEMQTPSPDPYKAASRRTAHGGQMPHVAEVDTEKYQRNSEKARREETNNGKRSAPDKGKAKNKATGGDSKPDWLEEKLEDDDTKKEGSMQRSAIGQHVATCPSCSGFGGVAKTEQGRAFIASLQRQGYSGLHQLDEIADPKDDPSETAYPTDVAFPMEQGGWAPNQQQQATDIPQAEQQIKQREQQRGASLSTEQLARRAAQEAYNQVHAARRPATVWDMFSRTALMQDDSGWLGDMGAGGTAPSQQDGLPPGGGNNLGQPDPVYGQGGDQPPGPRKPYGADEASDLTNNPGSWSPGQPTQYDVAGRGDQIDPGPAPTFPDDGGGAGNQFQNSKQSSFDADPQVRQAQQFLAQKARQHGVTA